MMENFIRFLKRTKYLVIGFLITFLTGLLFLSDANFSLRNAFIFGYPFISAPMQLVVIVSVIFDFLYTNDVVFDYLKKRNEVSVRKNKNKRWLVRKLIEIMLLLLLKSLFLSLVFLVNAKFLIGTAYVLLQVFVYLLAGYVFISIDKSKFLFLAYAILMLLGRIIFFD